MKYKVGQPVVYTWMNGRYEMGVILEILEGSIYPYKIFFPEDEDTDWYRETSVDDMIETMEDLEKEHEKQILSR
jgi:hypothetical protein